MADDIFDLWNFLRIGDVDTGAKNQELLGDLRDRAQYLAKKTGQEPVSFYEFKMQQPQKESKSRRNVLIGALIGGTLGALVTLPAFGVGAIAGLFFGGLLGAYTNTQNDRRTDLVKSYSNYLDGFEASAARAKSVSQIVEQTLRTDHAERVRASEQPDLSISR